MGRILGTWVKVKKIENPENFGRGFCMGPGQKSNTTFLQLFPKFERKFYYSFH